jgi:AraC-like DNA-binding protein
MTRLLRDGTVRIGPATCIPDVLKSLGADPAKVLSEAGLDLKLFSNPDNLISFSARSHLIALCQQETGCDHFGLLIGEKIGLSSFGLVGYLVQNSPDVDSALNNLVRYFHLHAQGAILVKKIENGVAFLGYSIYQPGVEASTQLEDAAIAIAYNILNTLCGPDWEPIKTCFVHRKPRDLKPFWHFFRGALQFDAGLNGVYFDVEFLQQPVMAADPELHRLLQKQINKLEADYGDDFPGQVKRVLITALFMGHGKIDQIAALFSMHSRTLNRRLSTYGTNFKQLADEVRYEIARQMLEASDIEVGKVSAMMGYSDASSFTKAFKRWSNTTPSRWREENKI